MAEQGCTARVLTSTQPILILPPGDACALQALFPDFQLQVHYSASLVMAPPTGPCICRAHLGFPFALMPYLPFGDCPLWTL